MGEPGSQSTVDPPAPDPRVDAAGVIIADVVCIGCEYNLRGLASEGKCPECGKAVAETFDSRFLITMERVWLDGLIVGVVLLLAHIVVTTVSAWCFFFAGQGTSYDGQVRLAYITLGASMLLGALGAWLVSCRHPGQTRFEGWLRLPFRIGAVAACALWLGWAINEWVAPHSFGGVLGYVAYSTNWGARFIVPIAWFCGLAHLRKIALWSGRRWLAHVTAILLGVYGVAASVYAASTAGHLLEDCLFWGYCRFGWPPEGYSTLYVYLFRETLLVLSVTGFFVICVPALLIKYLVNLLRVRAVVHRGSGYLHLRSTSRYGHVNPYGN